MAGEPQKVGFAQQIVSRDPAIVDQWLPPQHGLRSQPLFFIELKTGQVEKGDADAADDVPFMAGSVLP
jgi:hypothetical protein